MSVSTNFKPHQLDITEGIQEMGLYIIGLGNFMWTRMGSPEIEC